MQGIYKIINRENGKYYVGSSVDIDERWKQHLQKLNSGTHINPKLQASWNLHSSASFEFVVVEQFDGLSRKMLLEIEQKYLDIAKTEKSKTYNIKFVANGWDWDSEFLMNSILRGKNHKNYDHSVYTFLHVSTGEEFTGTRCDFYKKYGLEKKSVRKLVEGIFSQTSGWTLVT